MNKDEKYLKWKIGKPNPAMYGPEMHRHQIRFVQECKDGPPQDRIHHNDKLREKNFMTLSQNNW